MRKVLAGLFVAAAAATAERNWGSTRAERATLLPGDELVPEPATITTRAVDIAAPAEDVWPWLVQLGQDRAGLYSYDWLENAFGLHICNADRIHPEWQHLETGDRVRLIPAGWPPLPAGLALPVARIEPGRSLVLRMAPPEVPWDAIWSFHVIPTGPGSCRLISRSRGAVTSLARSIGDRLMDPVTLVMTRRMLLGIKQRAEQIAGSNVPQRRDGTILPCRPVASRPAD
jgi:hypothetical protein